MAQGIREVMDHTLSQPSTKEAVQRPDPNRQRFRAIFDNAAIGIALVDMSGRPVASNPALRRMLGYEAEELAAMVFTDFTHPDDVAADWELFQELVDNHRDHYQMEKRYTCKDGRTVWGRLTVSLVRDGAGQPEYAIGMVEDITARRQVEEQLQSAEERYQALVEQLPGIVYTAEFGESGRWQYASPFSQTMLGFAAEDWVADPGLWWRQVHPDDRSRVLQDEAVSRQTGDKLRSEYRIRTRADDTLWVLDVASVVRDEDGKPRLLQGVMLDITRQKRVEEELAQSLEDLRRSNQERLRILSRLVEAQEEERRRLADDIHDDTIQKLTAVGVRLGTLQIKHPGLSSDSDLKALSEAVRGAIAGLRHLIFELRPASLDREGLAAACRELLERVGDGLAGSLDDRLGVEPPTEVAAAAYRITQEALTNVRKHARATSVRIVLESRPGMVVVRVEDDGVGFRQHEAEGRPGHLGLTSMRERADLAGGHLTIESRPGRGTSVEIELPLRSGVPVT